MPAARRLRSLARSLAPAAQPAGGFASLDGRVALVTGVTDGSMGHGIALSLARQGCSVACVDVASHGDSLRRAADGITAETGAATLAITADCTDRAELESAFAKAAEALGELRIAVAAVGGMGYTGGRGAGQEVKDAASFVEADLAGGFADLIQTTQFATCQPHPTLPCTAASQSPLSVTVWCNRPHLPAGGADDAAAG